MRTSLVATVTALGALAGACSIEGLIGGGPLGGRPGDDPNAQAKDGGAGSGTPTDLPLPRLGRDEYGATLEDVVRAALPASAADVLSVVTPMAKSLPIDQLVTPPTQKHGGFGRLDQSEQQEYADVPFQIAVALGREMTKSPDRVAALLGACAAPDKACLEAFVRRFGELALRRPLADDDVAFYAASAPAPDASAPSIAQVVTVLLSSPRFLYHVESGGDAAPATGKTTRALDAWELASRLSYHFWGTMPDAALRDAARSGALLTDAGYAKEVDRLFADARTDATLRTFFKQWLWPLVELGPMDSRNGDPVFDAFAGADKPGPLLHDRMVTEVLDAASWVVQHGGSLAELLTNRQSFAKDADLAALYGVAPWSGAGDPPTLPGARAGLLTRAAFLATGTANTRPIMKGVFIRTTLLCDDVPPPPANAANTPINLSPNLTTREVIEQVTQQPNAVCGGCHKPLINPLGFASEGFDGLGRARTMQALFDAQGKLVLSKPVDTTSIPQVVLGDTTPSAGMADVTRLVVASGKVEACFAARYFRFTFRRVESATNDKPVIDALADAARGGKPLRDAIKAIAARPEFKQRTIPQ